MLQHQIVRSRHHDNLYIPKTIQAGNVTGSRMQRSYYYIYTPETALIVNVTGSYIDVILPRITDITQVGNATGSHIQRVYYYIHT